MARGRAARAASEQAGIRPAAIQFMERWIMEDIKKSAGVRALPLAGAMGIVWGLSVLGMGIATMYTTTYAHKIVDLLANMYYGYGPTWRGAFLGLAWGFGDAFFGTLIILGVYRLLACCYRSGSASAPEGS
jgi:hypothetical protein